MARYIVETEFAPGWIVRLYSGDNYERAASLANFWDERQNTYLRDRAQESPYDRAMRQFDEAIARLEWQKEVKPVTKSYVDRNTSWQPIALSHDLVTQSSL